MPNRMIWCPKCENCWLDNNGCPQCRLSIEELLEYMVDLYEEAKKSGGVSIDKVEGRDECIEMDCGVARENELLKEKAEEQEEEMIAINAENWKLKQRNRKLRKRLEKIDFEYNGPCPNCGNPVKRNRCEFCLFEANKLVVAMIKSLKKEKEGGE